MNLKVLLPSRIFSETKNVIRIVAETHKGLFGILPNRLDCVAALVPGIFTYETETEGVLYIAIDEGVLIKAGAQVNISVRNAIGGANLGTLRESVENEFKNLDEGEKNVRSVIAKLESGFIRNWGKFRKE